MFEYPGGGDGTDVTPPAQRSTGERRGGPAWSRVAVSGRRLLALTSEPDRDGANRVVSELALLDPSGDERRLGWCWG